MQKAHDASKNNYWKDYPNVETPIIAEQLNRNEQSVDAIDDRVVAFDTSKANQTDMLIAIKGATLDDQTGILTLTKFNGTTITLNLATEKIIINARYISDTESEHYQQLELTLADGTAQYVDLSALINQNEFVDSPTIRKIIDANGNVQFEIIDGSINAAKLNPDYLADITVQTNRAVSSAESAENSALASQSWAAGDTGTREGENTNNSKYYAQLAQDTVADLLTNFGVSVVGTRLVFGTEFEEQYGIEVVGTKLIISERT